MDFITANSLNWVLAIQPLGAWLEMPMRFFSFLGDENFYFMVLPLLYWSVDARLGIRVSLILITSTFVNLFFKFVFALPRPYWVSMQVQPFAAEPTFGIPSNHAQNAIVLWGMIAGTIRRRGRGWLRSHWLF